MSGRDSHGPMSSSPGEEARPASQARSRRRCRAVGQALRDRGRQERELEADVLLGPVVGLVARPGVDVMDLDLAANGRKAASGTARVVRARARAGPRPRTSWPPMSPRARPSTVARRGAARSRASPRRLRSPPARSGRPRRTARRRHPPTGAQHPGVGVGVASEVGEDVADGPSLQPARCPHGRVVEPGDGVEQAAVRRTAPRHHRLELRHGRRRALARRRARRRHAPPSVSFGASSTMTSGGPGVMTISSTPPRHARRFPPGGAAPDARACRSP